MLVYCSGFYWAMQRNVFIYYIGAGSWSKSIGESVECHGSTSNDVWVRIMDDHDEREFKGKARLQTTAM